LDERKSTGAFIFTINGTPITWSSKKQTCVALSSTESEYRALVEASKEAMWLKNLFWELGFLDQDPIRIGCDNQSTIRIAKNPTYHSKTKHFEIHLNFIRDIVSKQQIKILFTPTDKQPADILTKALGFTKFENCRKMLELTGTHRQSDNTAGSIEMCSRSNTATTTSEHNAIRHVKNQAVEGKQHIHISS